MDQIFGTKKGGFLKFQIIFKGFFFSCAEGYGGCLVGPKCILMGYLAKPLCVVPRSKILDIDFYYTSKYV